MSRGALLFAATAVACAAAWAVAGGPVLRDADTAIRGGTRRPDVRPPAPDADGAAAAAAAAVRAGLDSRGRPAPPAASVAADGRRVEGTLPWRDTPVLVRWVDSRSEDVAEFRMASAPGAPELCAWTVVFRERP